MSNARWVVAALLVLASGTGCCRMCDRWCGPRQGYYQPAPVYAQPAVAAPVQAGVPCCVPCCVPCNSSPGVQSSLRQPVAVPAVQTGGIRQAQYYPFAPAAGGACACN